MKKKTVMILGKLPPPYMGPSIATEILLKSELKNKFKLVHLETKINIILSSFGKWNFAKVFKNIAVYINMIRLLILNKPDVVLIPISQTTTGFLKDSIFILFAAFFRRKIVIQLRGSNLNNWLSNATGLTKSYFKFILKRTKGVIVLGENLRYLFKTYFSETSIFVIPNGGNYGYTKVVKDKNAEIKILFFSNFLESKGILDVLKSIEILSSKKVTHKYSIDFVGAWNNEDFKNKCFKFLENKNLPAIFHTAKSGKEKVKFLSEADIFVFPPRDPEGHPWAIVEAMAAGLPIISTDRGAIVESVIDSKNGFIVESHNPKMIADALKLLIENSELREQMGKESLQLYLKNFTEEKMIEKYETVFNTIITNEN
ncbi:MAG: glycosyltransferase [Bacteroidota bacterium]